MFRKRLRSFAPGLLLLIGSLGALPTADSTYLVPPKAIIDIVDAPPPPARILSPTRDIVAILQRKTVPSISEMAEPMRRLAGARINPQTNAPRRNRDYGHIIDIRLHAIADGSERRVTAPRGAELSYPEFSSDGRQLAFAVTRRNGIELWSADVATGGARRIADLSLNAAFGDPCDWLSDSTGLLCLTVPANRGPVPSEPSVPAGPNVQENHGTAAPVATYEDLLKSAYDETLFEHYFTSQLVHVDATSGQTASIGKPGLFQHVALSPDSRFLLTCRLKRPFSRLVPADDFPKEVEIWNRGGEVLRKIADLPPAETVPINGVLPGPRSYQWNPTAPATLIWVEALDGGDPRNKAPHRDRVVSLAAPFHGDPAELTRMEFRFDRIRWTDKGLVLVTESDRTKRRTRTWIVAAAEPPRMLWDRGTQDRYHDPGTPVTRPIGELARMSSRDAVVGGGRIVLQAGSSIYLSGDGSSPAGDRPFLDRLDLTTLTSKRVFQSADGSYEPVLGLLRDDGQLLLTERETPTDPPALVVLDLAQGRRRTVVQATDPAPALRGIEKQLLTYTRNDGVKLSATLYLPPGYKKGDRVPMLMWAYPREYGDPGTAGQVTGSPNRFDMFIEPSISSSGHLLLLTEGYAILDNATMPIIGAGETANDTYVEQLVASAKAAVDKVVEMGVADRDRIAVGGHSYGAFMTANLLAHSDLFRAGIARSGAYNRTLTPFGFQSERRTFWEIPDVYARMSPFFNVTRINEPILLIHGEADDNSGTFPIQSERLYMALRGNGKDVRYVTLPHEAHRYEARESLLHVLAEIVNWCDKYVKHAGPRDGTR
ncbi:MAG: prolyl oligopeptidase family serine peptidase [Acidobacteria bacterium]|nr:prolyl oligopeptidase family serine peptidase [Acidobacteriota bacterium]